MTVRARSGCALLAVGAALMAGGQCLAGSPQVMFYVTVPVGGHTSHDHMFGLRLDRTSPPPGLLVTNPASPLTKRALLDLQMGSDAGFRLDIGRRLTWDFGRQQFTPSSRPATVALRLPLKPKTAASRPAPKLEP